jgi:uncharacterized SAM-binding protein YcdF (DUF218 family)
MRIFVFLVCFCFLESCFFLGASPKKRLRRVNEIKPLDVIIVPGLPLYHGQWDTLLKTRILWSEFLYKKGYVKNVLYSGNAVYTPWMEGPSMALYAAQLGIDKEHILIDTIAEHSTENLYYGYQLAKQKGFKTIAVATDPFQCAMLHRFARKNFHDHIYFIPVIYDSILSRTSIELTIDTTVARKQNFISIQEKQDYKKRLKGTRGQNIKAK